MADVRSAGTVIGAVLESVGYHYQAHVLDVLGSPLVNEIGGFVYLVAVVLVIGAMVADGGFRGGVWLLIGPPLFLATITVRSEIPNAVWQYGEENRDQKQVQQGLQEKGVTGSARVSSVFGAYVRIISELNRDIISKLTNGRTKDDLDLLMKAELFARVHAGREFEPGMHELIHYAMLGECRDLIKAAEEVNDPLLREFDPDDPVLRGAFGDNVKIYKEFFTPSRLAAQKKYERQWNDAKVNLNGKASEFVAGMVKNGAPTKAEVEAYKGDGWYSCNQIWEWTLKALMARANQARAGVVRQAEANGLDSGRLQNLILRAHGVNTGKMMADDGPNQMSAGEIEQINRIIAQYYLRNEVSAGSFTSWLSHFEEKETFREIATDSQGSNSFTEQSRLGANEWAERGRIAQMAASLPYYQGLALFLLAVVFPFFALLLLIPGKHGGFLLWFMLWMWIKSWDIGFAIVAMLDQFLFAMLGTARNGTNIEQVNKDIGVTMASLRAMDPTFQLATHYSLIAIALLAIPTVMATLIMGSVKGGAGVIAKGADRAADFYARSVMQKTQQVAVDNLQFDVKELGRTMAEQSEKQAAGARQQLANGAAQGKLDAPGGGGDAPAGGGEGGGEGTGPQLARPGGSGGSNVPGERNSVVNVPRPAVGDFNLDSSNQQAMQSAGMAGFARGMNKPIRIGTSGKSSDFLNAVVDSAFAVGYGPRADIQGAVAGQEVGFTKDWLKAGANRGYWSAILSSDARKINAKMWLFGGIPITQTGFFQEASDTDIGLEFRARDMQSKARVARLQAAGAFIGEAEKQSQSFFKKSLGQLFGGGENVDQSVKDQREKLIDSLSTTFKFGAAAAMASDGTVQQAASEYAGSVLSAERYRLDDPTPYFLPKDVGGYRPSNQSEAILGGTNGRPYIPDESYYRQQTMPKSPSTK